jgi:hypothetical protein
MPSSLKTHLTLFLNLICHENSREACADCDDFQPSVLGILIAVSFCFWSESSYQPTLYVISGMSYPLLPGVE